MAPPATLTLATVIERMRDRTPMQVITLGICQGQIERDGEVWRVVELYGAIVGVSPHDDRPAERGAVVLETSDGGELVDRLIGELWTSRFGTMLGASERLRATVSGIKYPTRLLARLRNGWKQPISDDDAAGIIIGKRSLDADEARIVSTIVRDNGGTTRWTCVRS